MVKMRECLESATTILDEFLEAHGNPQPSVGIWIDSVVRLAASMYLAGKKD